MKKYILFFLGVSISVTLFSFIQKDPHAWKVPEKSQIKIPFELSQLKLFLTGSGCNLLICQHLFAMLDWAENNKNLMFNLLTQIFQERER